MPKPLKAILTIAMAPLLLASGIGVGFAIAAHLAGQAFYCSVGAAAAPIGYIIDGVQGLIKGDPKKIKFSPQQLNIASLIIGIGRARGESDDRILVLLMAGLTESNLTNDPIAHDHTSVGVFQMQDFWGTFAQRMDVTWATNRMYDELDRKVPSLERMTLGQAAQAIEVSAYPDRYASWEGTARAILASAVPTDKSSIRVVGDSLTVGSQSFLDSDLTASGWTDRVFSALVGRRISGGPQPDGLQAVDGLKQTGQQYWIVALGTNDAAGLADQSAAEQQIESVLSHLGSGMPVLWVNIYLPHNQTAQDRFNNALEAVQQRHQSQMLIADWASLAAGNPSWIVQDGVHYTTSGYRQRSVFIAKASSQLFGLTTKALTIGPSTDQPSTSICKTGQKIIDGVIHTVIGQVGLPFLGQITGIGRGVTPPVSSGLLSWAFKQLGYDLPTDIDALRQAGQSITSVSDAERGDIVVQQDSTGFRYGLYLGTQQVVLDPLPGEVPTISLIDWKQIDLTVRLKLDDSNPTIDGWQNPLQDHYTISSGFGYRTHPIRGTIEMHDGIDLAAADGTTVYAPASGTITQLAASPVDGAMVYIDHGNGIKTYYFDMAAFNSTLKVGDQVTAGDSIGTIGNCHCSGSTGAHVHFRVHVNDQPTDPELFMNERGVKL